MQPFLSIRQKDSPTSFNVPGEGRQMQPFLSIRHRDSPTSFDVTGEGRRAAVLSIRQRDSYTSIVVPGISVADPGCLSRIPDPGVKKAPDPGS
jgi:hypothetical protein